MDTKFKMTVLSEIVNPRVFNIGRYFPDRVVKIALVVALLVLILRVWDALVYVWG